MKNIVFVSCVVSINQLLVNEKQKVIAALCLHYTVMDSLAELEQLHRGLAIQKFNYLLT